MTATITAGGDGEITLPEPVQRLFGARPGALVRVEASVGRIELVTDVPTIAETAVSPSGRTVLVPGLGSVDVATACRGERARLADRAGSR